MIRSMFNVLKLIIEELPYEQCSVSHDIGHKKGIYEIFLHHLYRNFRKERQIRFYADKLNVSTVYLSRMVKEISGTTVNDHATSLVYKEICNLLVENHAQTGRKQQQRACNLKFPLQSQHLLTIVFSWKCTSRPPRLVEISALAHRLTSGEPPGARELTARLHTLLIGFGPATRLMISSKHKANTLRFSLVLLLISALLPAGPNTLPTFPPRTNTGTSQ